MYWSVVNRNRIGGRLSSFRRRPDLGGRTRGYASVVSRETSAALWRSRGWFELEGAATLARLGNEMFPIAAALLVLERTGSAALAGIAVAAFTLPSTIT